jgi:GTP-binding protein
MLIEMMRREGFELSVSRPEVITKRTKTGDRGADRRGRHRRAPKPTQGSVMAQVGARKGIMTKMVNHGSGRVRLEFRIPARGLIGFRSQFLTDTKRHGHHEPHLRRVGTLGRPDPVAHHRCPGGRPAGPGDGISRSPTCRSAARCSSSRPLEVYEGMIVGENSRNNDLDVNITKEKKQTNMRASSADEAIRFDPAAQASGSSRPSSGSTTTNSSRSRPGPSACASACSPRTCVRARSTNRSARARCVLGSPS